jgi:hypothetical protein
MAKLRVIWAGDGGGIRGAFTARILYRIELALGRRIVELFPREHQYFAGTSTSALIKAGLTLPGPDGRPKHDAADMVELFGAEGPGIFKKSRLRTARSWLLGGAKYPDANIDSVLTKYFGSTLFGEHNRFGTVIIPAVQTAPEFGPNFFQSDEPEDAKLETAFITRCSTAAPSYFNPARRPGSNACFIDGGLVDNSPGMKALVEAIKDGGADGLEGLEDCRDEYLVITIGTGESPHPYTYDFLRNARPFQLLTPALDILYRGQHPVAVHQLKHILKRMHPFRGFYNFNADLPSSMMALDNGDPKNIQRLIDKADEVVDKLQRDDFRALIRELRELIASPALLHGRRRLVTS